MHAAFWRVVLAIMGEAAHVWGQRVYGKPLNPSFNFGVNLKPLKIIKLFKTSLFNTK